MVHGLRLLMECIASTPEQYLVQLWLRALNADIHPGTLGNVNRLTLESVNFTTHFHITRSQSGEFHM